MKTKITFLSVAVMVAALVSSCTQLPTADFTTDPATDIIQYDAVTFTNMSLDAVSYAWDFGDGGSSTEESPVHIFKSAGSFTVTLVATNEDGDTEVTQTVEVAAHNNTYTIDDTVFQVDSSMFWFSGSTMGSPYIRLLTPVDGQDNPDLLKLYPNMGLGELPGTYTWDNTDMPAGTFDVGYTANYAGFVWDWLGYGKEGSGDLVIEEVETDIYRITGEFILSVGDYDTTTWEFVETSTSTLSIDYIGEITPL